MKPGNQQSLESGLPPHQIDSWNCSFQRAGSSLGTGARAMVSIVRSGLKAPGPQTCLS